MTPRGRKVARAVVAVIAMAGWCSACASLGQAQHNAALAASDARLALRDAAKFCDAYKRAVAAGDVAADKYVDGACALLLEPVTP